ncbi:MAG: 3-phosphoshikimate 1-carboxyvinyltransferase, partial [Leisingera sp.]
MSGHGTPIPMTSHRCGPLTGTAEVPGDKSISHRSLILGALSVGETKISGLLEGEDVLDTAKAMQAFGAEVVNHGGGNWAGFVVGGCGFAGPGNVIGCGNPGTGVRRILGGKATLPLTAPFTGASSLKKRPPGR